MRTTRNSIRLSLNQGFGFTKKDSPKDTTETRKATIPAGRKSTDTNIRRSSTMSISKPTALVGSENTSVSTLRSGKTKGSDLDGASASGSSPDKRTLTQRNRAGSRASKMPISEVDELGIKNSDDSMVAGDTSTTMKRTSSVLRPRNGSSALPKYRPKSVLSLSEVATVDAPSPLRSGTRKKHGSSEEEREDKTVRGGSQSPKRPTFKSNLPTSVTGSPGVPTNKVQKTHQLSPSGTATPTPKGTPKQVKTSTMKKIPPQISRQGSPSPRNPPSGKGTKVGNVFRRLSSNRSPFKNSNGPSSSANSSLSSFSLSPKGKVEKGSAKKAKGENGVGTPTRSPSKLHLDLSSASTPNLNVAAVDVDSEDDEDVEMLLSAVASPTAPTPALPRFRTNSNLFSPQTPSRSADSSPASLTFSHAALIGRRVGDRSSLSQYSHMSTPRSSVFPSDSMEGELSGTLEDSDLPGMISEIVAPFSNTPGLLSPYPTHNRLNQSVPPSPTPPGLPSPGHYESISRVFLPTVTPSPAAHVNFLPESHYSASDTDEHGGATQTLLRLQLAAKDELIRRQAAQIEQLKREKSFEKETLLRGRDSLANGISELEARVTESVTAKAHAEEENLAALASLEDQLRQADLRTSFAVKEAVTRARAESDVQLQQIMQRSEKKLHLTSAVRGVRDQWANVRFCAEKELEKNLSEQETLAVLMEVLECHKSQLLVTCVR